MCFSFILVKLALLGNFDLDQPLVGWRRNAQAMIKSYYGDNYSNAVKMGACSYVSYILVII